MVAKATKMEPKGARREPKGYQKSQNEPRGPQEDFLRKSIEKGRQKESACSIFGGRFGSKIH